MIALITTYEQRKIFADGLIQSAISVLPPPITTLGTPPSSSSSLGLNTSNPLGTPPLSFDVTQKGVNIARRLMVDLNLSKIQAAAIVGNLIAESGLYPDRIQGSGIKRGLLRVNGSVGYGYAQWTSASRQQALANYALSKGVNYLSQNLTDEINYGFLVQELKSKRAYQNLLRENTLIKATEVILKQYERPADQSSVALNKRTSLAQQILNKM